MKFFNKNRSDNDSVVIDIPIEEVNRKNGAATMHERRINDYEYAREQRRLEYPFNMPPIELFFVTRQLTTMKADMQWVQETAQRRSTGKTFQTWLNYELSRGTHKPFFLVFYTFVSIALMIYAFYMNNWKFESMKVNPLFGPSIDVLLDLGANDYEQIKDEYEFWRPFTSTFLHGGIIHLLFSICAVLMVGIPLEIRHGTIRFGLLFLFTSYCGNLMSAVCAHTNFGVGSTAGLYGFFGIMLADVFVNWDALTDPIEYGTKSLPLFILIELCFFLFPILTSFVDQYAILGGFLFGFLLGCFFIQHIKNDIVASSPDPAIQARSKKLYYLRVLSWILAILIMTALVLVAVLGYSLKFTFPSIWSEVPWKK